MDPLPIRTLSEIFPLTIENLRGAARQGALYFHTLTFHHEAESQSLDRAQTCVRMRAIYQYALALFNTCVELKLGCIGCSRSPCRVARFCNSWSR